MHIHIHIHIHIHTHAHMLLHISHTCTLGVEHRCQSAEAIRKEPTELVTLSSISLHTKHAFKGRSHVIQTSMIASIFFSRRHKSQAPHSVNRSRGPRAGLETYPSGFQFYTWQAKRLGVISSAYPVHVREMLLPLLVTAAFVGFRSQGFR